MLKSQEPTSHPRQFGRWLLKGYLGNLLPLAVVVAVGFLIFRFSLSTAVISLLVLLLPWTLVGPAFYLADTTVYGRATRLKLMASCALVYLLLFFGALLYIARHFNLVDRTLIVKAAWYAPITALLTAGIAYLSAQRKLRNSGT